MTRAEEAAAVSSELSYLPWRRALLVGLAPVAMPVPGASATGLAMVFGLARTMSHEQAVRFGLVVLTPGLLVLGLREMSDGPPATVLLAAGVGAVAAYLAAALLMRYFKTATLRPFGLYCLLAGSAAAWWLLR
jgi:undecaprenyl-diphosphatase